MCAHVHAGLCIGIHICAHVHMGLCIGIHICAHVHTGLCMGIHICAHVQLTERRQFSAACMGTALRLGSPSVCIKCLVIYKAGWGFRGQVPRGLGATSSDPEEFTLA